MPMSRRHNPNPRRTGYTEGQQQAITPLENLKPDLDLKVNSGPYVGNVAQDKRNPSQQTQAHVDYRNSDAYKEELSNRSAVTDSMEKAHLATLSQSGRKYVYDRSMENSSPSEKAAADNTRVTPKKNK